MRMNPRRRRHHRRNPGSPYLAAAGAFILSLVVGTVEMIAPVLVSKDAKTIGYVQTGLGLVGTGAGIALAKKHPMIGLAIGIPSVAALLGSVISGAVGKLLTSVTSPKPTQGALVNAQGQPHLGALVQQLGALVNAQGQPRLGAVFADNVGAVFADNVGAVFADGMGDLTDGYAGMGAPLGGPPWNQGTPFG